MKFKLIYKNMTGNNTLKEGSYKELWDYLVKTEGDKSLDFVCKTYEIKPL